MAAVELDADVLAARPAAVVVLQCLAREHGVLLRPLLRSVAMSPPLVCESADIELIAHGLAEGLDRLTTALQL
jgi:adenosylmethionine-8-amino-7-oxononanoate aminotransferase